MNEAPAVLLDFGALFARKSDSQIVKVGLDRTMFLNEAVNNSFEENAVGEHFVIEHQIETTISTIQEKFYRNSYGEEPGAFDLLPFRGVLAEISERCAGKLAGVSSPLLPPECTELLDEYELTNTVITLTSGMLVRRLNCILVSENLQHIVAGKEAGVQTVGVLTREESALSALGDTNATILEFYRAGADHVIRSGLSELLDLIVFVDPAPLKHASESQYQYATFAHGMCPLWEKPPRIGTVQYTSRKSGVSCAVNLDGTGLAHISTGVSFLDYVIALLAQYGSFDISLVCVPRAVHWERSVKNQTAGTTTTTTAGCAATTTGVGDATDAGSSSEEEGARLRSVEDCATALGEAFDKALGSRVGIRCAGSAYGIADEAQCRAVVDLAARPYAVLNLDFNIRRNAVGGIPCDSIEQMLRIFALSCRINMHITCLYSAHSRHKVASAFKALGAALRQAVEGSGT